VNRQSSTVKLAGAVAAALLTAGTAVVTTSIASAAPQRDGADHLEASASRTAGRAGWVLPAVASVHGDKVNTSYGVHCGSSRFGVYHLTGGLTNRGRQSAWKFDLEVTDDGALHRARNVRFTRYTPARVRKQVRRIFATTRYHYVNSNGRELIQGLYADGTQQATMPFNPRQGRC
jgi:hypothetical protein